MLAEPYMLGQWRYRYSPPFTEAEEAKPIADIPQGYYQGVPCLCCCP